LLVGEAAHLFAPFGARGLNSGVADATAAAGAIATAVGGTGGDTGAAVDGFGTTRRRAAAYNRAAAAKALEHMQARGVRVRVHRFVAARRAIRGLQAGKWLDSAPYGPPARDRAAEADGVY
jgi:3-(3-hydroxy-phenyl)propionate hydroxylase